MSSLTFGPSMSTAPVADGRSRNSPSTTRDRYFDMLDVCGTSHMDSTNCHKVARPEDRARGDPKQRARRNCHAPGTGVPGACENPPARADGRVAKELSGSAAG